MALWVQASSAAAGAAAPFATWHETAARQNPASCPALLRLSADDSQQQQQQQQQDLLPTDYQYTWANDSYSKGQRTRDTWTFVLLLRARLWLLDQVCAVRRRGGPGGVVGVGRLCFFRQGDRG